MLNYCRKCGQLVDSSFSVCSQCGFPTAQFTQQPQQLASNMPYTKNNANIFKCYDCGEEISRYLEHCPYCGRIYASQQLESIEASSDRPIYALTALVIGIILLVGGVAMLSGVASPFGALGVAIGTTLVLLCPIILLYDISQVLRKYKIIQKWHTGIQ